MILDLRALKRSGKEREDFFFEYSPSETLVELPSVKLKLPVKINGEILLLDEHSAEINGEVCFSLVGECTRCLKDTEKEFIISFTEIADNEDEEGYPVKNDTVDLSKIVDDVISMNIPLNFLCKEDCKGICVGCGVNLNDEDCKCKNK